MILQIVYYQYGSLPVAEVGQKYQKFKCYSKAHHHEIWAPNSSWARRTISLKFAIILLKTSNFAYFT